MPLLTLMLLLLYVITVFTAVIVIVVSITDARTVALQKERCSFTSDLGFRSGFHLGFNLGFHAKTRNQAKPGVTPIPEHAVALQ